MTSPVLISRLFALALLLRSAVVPASGASGLHLVDARRIWSEAPHNAFTDLVRWKDRWWCVFREGSAHVSPDGSLRVIVSGDGERWQSAARIVLPGVDLRDAKVCVTPEGLLMLNGAGAYPQPGPVRHRSFVWFSRDGSTWSEALPIGDDNQWLWRVTWHQGTAWSVGYDTLGEEFTRLYRSGDGRRFSAVVPRLVEFGRPNEHALHFAPDGSAWCLLRRDGQPGMALLGHARPPFVDWEWSETNRRIGGPSLLALPDGRLLAAVRLYDAPVRTALCWLDPETARLTEALALPSGGDTSYAGMVWEGGKLWVSYYSSHEERTSIYLARVTVDPQEAISP